MVIRMSKRKKGIYAQWFVVDGLNKKRQQCTFLISFNQAKNYAQAVRFFNETWGIKGCVGIVLRNTEPASDSLIFAA